MCPASVEKPKIQRAVNFLNFSSHRAVIVTKNKCVVTKNPRLVTFEVGNSGWDMCYGFDSYTNELL